MHRKNKSREDEASWTRMEQSEIIKFREGEIINNCALGLLETATNMHFLPCTFFALCCDLILFVLPLHFLLFRCLNQQRWFNSGPKKRGNIIKELFVAEAILLFYKKFIFL